MSTLLPFSLGRMPAKPHRISLVHIHSGSAGSGHHLRACVQQQWWWRHSQTPYNPDPRLPLLHNHAYILSSSKGLNDQFEIHVSEVIDASPFVLCHESQLSSKTVKHDSTSSFVSQHFFSSTCIPVLDHLYHLVILVDLCIWFRFCNRF